MTEATTPTSSEIAAAILAEDRDLAELHALHAKYEAEAAAMTREQQVAEALQVGARLTITLIELCKQFGISPASSLETTRGPGGEVIASDTINSMLARFAVMATAAQAEKEPA